MNELRAYVQKRQAALGLSQNELARKAGKSGAWLSRFITGEAKEMHVDSLLALAKALEVPEIKLISAYKGIDPDSVEPMPKLEAPQPVAVETPPKLDLEAEAIKASFKAFVQSLPVSVIAQMVDPVILMQAIRAHRGAEKFQELLEEARRLKDEQEKE